MFSIFSGGVCELGWANRSSDLHVLSIFYGPFLHGSSIRTVVPRPSRL